MKPIPTEKNISQQRAGLGVVVILLCLSLTSLVYISKNAMHVL